MPTSTYTQIHKSILGSGQSSISFTTIDSTYTDLRIIVNARITNDGYAIGMRFNNDSSGIYGFRQNSAINNSVFVTDRNNFVYAGINRQTTNNALDNLMIVDIFDYNATDKFKTYCSQSAMRASNSASDTSFVLGCYRSTNAITRIDFAECGDGGSGTFGTGNLQTGTSVIIYGIKAGS
jgi:hypothetical protein